MTQMQSTAPALSLLHFAATTGRGRRPRRFAHMVGLMAVHTTKGVYLGADSSDAPVYASRRGIATSKRDQLIPLLPEDVALLTLKGMSVDDKRCMHLFQVAALENAMREGYRYTDVRRAFHFSSGDIKTVICERSDETVHYEAPIMFNNPAHFRVACQVMVAANRFLPFGKQPAYIPLG